MKRRITSGENDNLDNKNQAFNLKRVEFSIPKKTLIIENNIDNSELEDFFKNIQDRKVYKTILTTLNDPQILPLFEKEIITLPAVASFFDEIGRNVAAFESILKHPGVIETLGLSEKWEFDNGKIKLSALSELFTKVGCDIESFKKIMREDVVRLLNNNISNDPNDVNGHDTFLNLWEFLDGLPTGHLIICTEEGQELNKLNVESKYTTYQIEVYTKIFNIPGIVDLLAKRNCDNEQCVYLKQLLRLFDLCKQDIGSFEKVITTQGVMKLLDINENQEQQVALDELCYLLEKLHGNTDSFVQVITTPEVIELLGINENQEQQVALDVLVDLFTVLGENVEEFKKVITNTDIINLLTTAKEPQNLTWEELIGWCQDQQKPLSQEDINTMVQDVLNGNFFETEEI